MVSPSRGRVEIWEPVLDLYDEDIALTRPLTLGKGQFSLSTGVLLCIDCPSKGRDPRDPRTGRDKGRDRDPAKDRDHGRDPERDRDRDKDDEPRGALTDVPAPRRRDCDTSARVGRRSGYRRPCRHP